MIPTAEEFLKDLQFEYDETGEKTYFAIDVPQKLIEFAKLCCIEQAKVIYNNATVSNKAKFAGDINYQVDDDSILKAYDLSLIK